jgi:hypothetical protein
MTQQPPPGTPLPTLTEVVELPAAPLSAPREAAQADEAALVQRVLATVQQRVDLMLEQRIREALAPAWARVADEIIEQARAELPGLLREVVVQAVEQARAEREPR